MHYRARGDGGGEGADYEIGVHVVKLTKGKEDGGSSLLREAEGGSRWWLHLKNAEQTALQGILSSYKFRSCRLLQR